MTIKRQEVLKHSERLVKVITTKEQHGVIVAIPFICGIGIISSLGKPQRLVIAYGIKLTEVI